MVQIATPDFIRPSEKAPRMDTFPPAYRIWVEVYEQLLKEEMRRQ